MTFEQIAAKLGAGGVDWVVDYLRRYARLVGYHSEGYDDSWDRLALEGARNLQRWLMMEAEANKMIGDDPPDCIDDVSSGLDELLPLIAENIHRPGRRGGPTPDDRRYVCANVCRDIWQEFYDTEGSNSEALLAACEAYWQACGQPPTPADLSGHLRNWKWFLASNPRKKSVVR